MNTPQSQLIGWGSLIAAAGVSYYYARQNINERRKAQEFAGARPSEKLDWRARIAQQEQKAAAGEGSSSTPAAGQVDPSKSGGPSAPK
ncbi:uncharacterized protein C8Q71DRAFT_81562 [Rhodofomes roseus]|uniref:Uncharacterized protein n=1 Tax=Rhodofomes roseus TaxID=34475 RepID=A0ABQ8KFT4_9APHY|nr:uncharacterized protein C8Q71DRAFT_81562 [Rhodofomes roseus]KAH9836390.1 hypothetical protein C8Q71DRAFT_81562 [Rhodofomes roseus]